ncbi:endonuclease-reverse transcriptase, partial [Paramuricea clavata]
TKMPIRNFQHASSLEGDGSSSGRFMTSGGENWKSLKATRPITLLSTRKINIGTWNVRTMYETGKTAQVATEMRKYNLTILGISESGWTKSKAKYFIY